MSLLLSLPPFVVWLRVLYREAELMGKCRSCVKITAGSDKDNKVKNRIGLWESQEKGDFSLSSAQLCLDIGILSLPLFGIPSLLL